MTMSMLLTLAVILSPALILTWWLRRQTTPPRPWLLVVAVLGIVSFSFWWTDPFTQYYFALWGSLLDQLGMTRTDSLLYPFVDAFIGASLYEEVFKLMVLGLVSLLPGMLRTGREGAVWGALVGIGHAVGENMQPIYLEQGPGTVAVGEYMIPIYPEQGPGTVLVAGGLKLVITTAWGVIMGYSLGEARAVGSWRGLGMALLALVVLHGFYNFGVLVVQGPASPYLEREEVPPWPQALSMLATTPAALVTTVIWGFWVARKAFAPKGE